MTAEDIMAKMVSAYRDARVYLDNAEYGEHFVLAADGVQRQGPPLSVSVLLKRPNQFRITRVEPRADGNPDAAVVACDGEKLEAMIARLEPQRLSLPAPKVATLGTIAPDPLLRKALFPVPIQDMFPQLALLLADESETPWPLAAPSGLLLLPAKDIHSSGSPPVPCYRVRMQTTMGPQICWIEKETFLLLRMELPSEELRKQRYPDHEFTSFNWRFDFYDATLDVQLPTKTFRLESSDGDPAPEVVTAFHEPATGDKNTQNNATAGDAVSEAGE